jgi:hypothetical protein
MTKTRIRRSLLLGALAALGVLSARPALAACDAAGNPSPAGSFCYKLRGSDTLFDIMTEAIRQARLDGGGTSPLALAAKDLFYQGTGSGNAETAMRTATATALGSQSIGPMSRNFRPNIIDALSTTFTARSASATTAVGHAAWYPTSKNVVGLDAAVFVVKNTAPLENLTFRTFTDSAIPESAFDKAAPNDSSLQTQFGNPGAFNKLNPAFNYNDAIAVILSGVDGSGTLAACSDPRRVQAVQDLASLLNVATLQHVLRRDENSGTTDTFKDRIMVVAATSDTARYPFIGGRFCNGASIGGITGTAQQQGICSNNRATLCSADADCGAGRCWFNLNNPDYDPIRRPCMAADAQVAPTSCTDMTTGLPCQASDGNPNCTQGLVVALSDADANVSDITTSIGSRIGNSAGDITGFAGREAASSTFGTKALAINTHRATDAKVRSSLYLLARRLFIQNSYENSVSSWDIPTDSAGGGGGNGGSDQLTKEQNLWTNFLSDRSKMDSIVRQFNFIRCGSAGDGSDPDAESNNLCSLAPAAAVPSPLGNYQPTLALSGVNGGTRSISFDGRVPTVVTSGAVTVGFSQGRTCTTTAPCTCSTTSPCQTTPLVRMTASSGAQCVSGVADASGCPQLYTTATTKKATGAPCTLNAECTSGSCGDLLGTAVPGEAHDLYCQ